MESFYDQIENDISNSLDQDPTIVGNKWVWDYTKFSGLYDCRVELDAGNDTVKYTVDTLSEVRYVSWLLFLLFPVIFLGNRYLSGFLGICYALLVIALMGPDQSFSFGSSIGKRYVNYSNYMILSFIMVLLTLWWLARSNIPAPAIISDILFPLLSVVFVSIFFIEGREGSIIPRLSPGHFFYIPLAAVLAPVLSFISFLVGPGIISEGISWRSNLFLISFSVFLAILSLYLFLYFCGYIVITLRESPVSSLGSLPVRLGFLLMYSFVYSVLLIAIFAVAVVIFEGITGFYPYAASEETVRTGNEGYQLLDSIFSFLPVFPPRFYSILLLLTVTSHIVLVGMSWILHLCRTVWIRLKLLRSERLSEYSEDLSELGSDYPVLVVESDSRFCHSLAVFGFLKYIVVSEGTLERLSKRELKAMLAHERYHLENYDPIVNMLASVFAIFLGGRNSLLAFYNYPRIEEKADDYAVERTSLDDVKNAIGKMRRKNQREVRLFLAPYEVFFGSFLFEVSHRDPDKRIKRLKEKYG
ncbi:MAG: M56 family metallopeptidase [Halobacteriales archaeon]|nr:M56 family metallopeptidase [Halobacteriales archaeon]